MPWVAAFVALLAVTAPAAARQHKRAQVRGSCSHPCTHVDDCPKVTCECANGTASGVAACDTEKTHCCTSASTACQRFCEVHQQKWTGRFTPSDASAEGSDAARSDDGGTSDSNDAGASAPGASCEERCEKAEDCRPITCQCAHATAPDVAACDVTTHCCGSARVVCGHYCVGKKGKWTGKVLDSSPPPSSLDTPDGGEGRHDDGSDVLP